MIPSYQMKKGIIIRLAITLLAALFALCLIPAFSIEVVAADSELIELTSAGGALPTGSYILKDNVKLSKNLTIASGVYVTIDLNGYMLRGTGAGSVIVNNGTLTIKDSRPDSEPHYFEKKTDAAWVLVTDSAEINENCVPIYGGIITGGRYTSTGSKGGGAVQMGAMTEKMALHLQGGTIVGNHSNRAGGGVYGGACYMEGGVICGNYAKLFGGAVSVSGAFHMSGGLIYENHMNPDSIHNIPSDSTKFYDYPSITIGENSTFTMTGGELRGNMSTVTSTNTSKKPDFRVSGGTIYGKFRIMNRLDATISGGTLNGSIFMRSGKLTISGDAMIQNGVATNGGGVWITKNGNYVGTLVMTGGTIQGCTATEKGGAIYLDGGSATVSGGMIKDCSAAEGGAVCLDAGSFQMSGEALIQGNEATQNGGAIYLAGGNATVAGGTMSQNDALYGGGAYLAGGSLTVSGGSIFKNTAEKNGAGAYLTGGSLDLSGGSFLENVASENGGGAYLTGGSVTVRGGSFQGNRAANGGGVYVTGGSVSVTGGAIEQNRASQDGGGFYVNNGNFTMSGGRIDANRAESGNGGGLYVCSEGQDFSVDILSGSISGNYAAQRGGALTARGTGSETIAITVGVNDRHYDEDGNRIDCLHGDTSLDCPVIQANRSTLGGGALYVTGTYTAQMNLYCLIETGNNVFEGDDTEDENKPSKSDFMMVDGGSVLISTAEVDSEGNPIKDTTGFGNVQIENSLFVTGGRVDIYGTMANPLTLGVITVDIISTTGDDWFHDQRGDDSTYYKIQYFENFTPPGASTPTGQYMVFTIPWDQTHTIQGFIYEHTGYRIGGWYTKTTPPVKYDVGLTQAFNQNLELYAEWVPSGYVVIFDSNVGMTGGVSHTWSGTMANAGFQYNTPKDLPLNAFVYYGYVFIGWRDASGKTYADGQEILNLAANDGDEVTLYAVWMPCSHTEGATVEMTGEGKTHTIHFTYTKDGSVLIRTCSCGGVTQRATLSAEDVTYDGLEHFDDLKVTATTKNGTMAPDWTPVRLYTFKKNDSTDPISVTSPVNAGLYTVSITEKGVTASRSYRILKAEQSAPPIPTFDVEDMLLSIQAVADSAIPDAETQYQIVVRDAGVTTELAWQTGLGHTMSQAYTSYFVRVKYTETDNYLESPISTSVTIYFYTGGVKIIVDKGEGIDYTMEASELEGALVIEAFALEGYYLRGLAGTSSAGDLVQNGVQFRFSNVPSGVKEVTITLNGATRTVKVTPTVTEREVFGTVSGSSASIGRDSAFTAQFQVEFFAFYENLALQLSQPLPIGTTLILSNGTGYWYYVIETPTSFIPLSEFLQMGVAVDSGVQVAIPESFTFRFAVNFANTAAGCPADDLMVTLTASGTDGEVPTFPTTGVGVALCDVTFSLEEAVEPVLDADRTLSFSYAVSNGASSRWETRRGTLVLIPGDGTSLPFDAALVVVENGADTVTYYPNAEGFFIIPLNSNAGRLQLTLTSDRFPAEGATYTFFAALTASGSLVGGAPMGAGNEMVMIPSLQFGIFATREPSLTVTSDRQLLPMGGTLEVLVTYAGLTGGYTLEADLMYKNPTTGRYNSTGWSTEFLTVESEEAGEGETSFRVPLEGQNAAGSYCLELHVKDGNGKILLRVPYYFIIQ